MDREITFSKIPYCDYFAVRFQYHVTQLDDSTKLEIKLYVHFMKSTVFESKIQNSTIGENAEIINLAFIPQS